MNPKPIYTPTDESFGATLRQLRRARGLSLRSLERLSGVSYSYLSMLETEQRRPAMDTIAALADALQLSPEQATHLFLTTNTLPPGRWTIREDGSLMPA